MMKGKLVFLVLSLFVVSLVFNACSESEGSESQDKVKEERGRSVNVEVMEVKGEEFTDYISVIGTVKPYKKASLSSDEGGRIKQFLKDKGSYVKQGETILIIDNDILKAGMAAVKAQYDLDEITFVKQEQIFKDNVSSEFQLLQSKYKRDQSKANYELIKSRYNKTFIKAPFNGVLDKKVFEEGEFAPPGIPIIDLINTQRYKVEAGVPERFVGKVEKGDVVKLKLKNVESETFNGVVTYVGTSIITDNRTFPVEITIKLASKIIKPELAVEVNIINSEYDNVICVPDEVVSRVDYGYIVYVEENGIAIGKMIKILNRTGDKIAIESGLADGEKLITVGYQNLIEGQKVTVVN